MRAPTPPNDVSRVRSLLECCVMDTPPEPAFDELVELAARLCTAPISMVSLVDDERQWFKARRGLEITETPRDSAFCSHAIMRDEPLIVEDAEHDERFATNPLVVGPPHVRFYAGVPLRLRDGTRPGTLCVIDTVPRTLGADELRALKVLASQVSAQLELRRTDACLTRADASRAQLQEWYQGIARASLDACYLLECVRDEKDEIVDFVFLDLNQRGADLAGFDREEIIGQRLCEIMPVNRRDGFFEKYAEAVRTGKGFEEAFEVEVRSGERRWLHHQVVPLANGIGISTRDVTNLRRDDSERRRLHLMLQTVVDAMPQRVFWKDREGRFLGCNLGFAKDAGLSSPAEMIGTRDADHAWRVFAERYRADDMAVMAEGRARLNFEEPQVDSSGTMRWVRTSKIPLRDDSGEIIGVIGILEDVTAERDARQALRWAKEAAEEAARVKSEFLANMSHEIRTPMTAILGFVDLLADPSTPERDRPEFLATIRRNGEHLLTLINDILDHSKLEAGEVGIERLAFDPVTLTEEAASMLRPLAEAKGVELHAEIDPGLPRAAASDPTRLRQIILNLVNNAVKFTDRGQVRLAVRPEADAEGLDTLVFTITDTGIGMTEAQIARLFRPFTQADSSTSRRFGGTGLGLFITRRLVDLLGGEVKVASVVGEGTTFTVRIPVSAATDAVVPTSPSTPKTRLRGRILLAEDGADNQRLLTHILGRAGAEVMVAGHGRAACDAALASLAEGCGFDLILMDMQMPEMDGCEATARLRGVGWTGPIVALTANAMPEDRERCLRAGCDDYLTKPIDRRALLELCSRMMSARKAA